MRATSSVSSFLPLRPIELEILVALADAERHGYAIHKEVARRTGGQVELEPGTLYRALRRLLEARLVVERRPAAGEDDRRRTYRITDLGRRVTAAEIDRMAELVSSARRALGRA
jgi:DNA-binding PadR family transcriptional regulator